MFYKGQLQSYSGQSPDAGSVAIRYVPRWPWRWLGWKTKTVHFQQYAGIWRNQKNGRAPNILRQYMLDDAWARAPWLLSGTSKP